MTRLVQRDIDAVLRLIPKLYVIRKPLAFFEDSLRLIRTVVGFDYGTWIVSRAASTGFGPQAEHGREGTAQLIKTESELRITGTLLPKIRQSVTRHPFGDYWMTSGDLAVLIRADLPECTQRERERRCEDLYRPVKLKQYASVQIRYCGPVDWTLLTVVDDRCPFTERDLKVLTVLQPHLQRAHANAEFFGRLDLGAALVSAASDQLTVRESEIMCWLGRGKTNLEIGLILGITRRTVEKHVEHILKKLRVENRTAAAIQVGQTNSR